METRFEASAVLDGSKSALNLARQFASKLRSVLKKVSKSSVASVMWKDSTCVVKRICGTSPELCSEFDKDPRPSSVFAASKSSSSTHASTHGSYSKLSSGRKSIRIDHARISQRF